MLGFLITTYAGDEALARRLIAQIGQHYPDAPVVACCDRYSPDLPCLTYNLAYSKTPSNVHRYSRERLWVGAQMDADRIVQIDPDCYLSKPFQEFPKGKWGGRLCVSPTDDNRLCKHMHGCCWVMDRDLMTEIVEANPFELEDYQQSYETSGAPEDIGLALGINRIYPHANWRTWGEVNIMGRWDSGSVHHPIKDISATPPSKKARTVYPMIR